MRVRSARLRTDLGLDSSGFQLITRRSALQDPRDYEDDERIRSIYYPEVIAALREVTGAAKVVVFDHTVRDSTPNHGREGIREIAARVHARSIETRDLVVTDHKYRDWTGETFSFLYSERHRWFYYPRQLRDEATLLKIYDSQTDGTAHTAFDDPTTPPDAPARRSIEVRTLLFF